MTKVRVHLQERSYDILIGPGLLSRSGAIIGKLRLGKDAIVATNKAIARLYGKILQASLLKSGISSKIEIIPDSEKSKSHKTLIYLLNKIGAYDTKRTIFLIAFGGGVVGDLTGFAASIYKRGVPYVQIPTTLLAQVDSAIGGKTAIDLPSAKNLVGSFCQPRIVISDVSLLKSLSKRQLRSGLAECIKYAIIRNKGLFRFLENNYRKALTADRKALERVILSCSRIKARLVEEDEFDKTGKRAILNYGHTLGHAIEAAAGYSKRYNHGEAIAVGMIIAADISAKLRLISDNDLRRIKSLINKCGLPIKISALKLSAIYDAHLHDKKFIRGKNRFILPAGIGRVKIVEGISDSIVKRSIRENME